MGSKQCDRVGDRSLSSGLAGISAESISSRFSRAKNQRQSEIVKRLVQDGALARGSPQGDQDAGDQRDERSGNGPRTEVMVKWIETEGFHLEAGIGNDGLT